MDSSNHHQRRRRRHFERGNTEEITHSTMERRTSLKRRRNDRRPLSSLGAAVVVTSLPPLTHSIRSRNLRTRLREMHTRRHLAPSEAVCLTSQASIEVVPPYLPSYSYSPSDKAAINNMIYECKPFPFNGWCGDYEPGNSAKPWGDAWILVGECTLGALGDVGKESVEQDGVNDGSGAAAAAVGAATTTASESSIDWSSNGVDSTASGMEGSLTGTKFESTATASEAEYTMAENNSCSNYEPYSSQEIYIADDVLSANGRIYKCLQPPADSWCSLGGYEPGTGMYWTMAWEDVGRCREDAEEQSVELTVNSTTPARPEKAQCGPLYNPSDLYTTESIISFQQFNHVCIVPIWCNQEAYAPTEGNTMTAAAWKKDERECKGVVTAMPTAEPTGSPVEFISESPTSTPSENATETDEWVNISNEVVIIPIEDDEPQEQEPEAFALLVDPQDNLNTTEENATEEIEAAIRTMRPSASPIITSHLPQCAPLFTQGHAYELKELISFENYNYQCEVLAKCSDVQYAPRIGEENQGAAWWKVEECTGGATRHPTPRPTPRAEVIPIKQPSAPDKVDVARDAHYSSLVPEAILNVLNENMLSIQKSVLVSQMPDYTWEYSQLYTFDDFIVALGVMTEHPATSPFFLGGFGTQSSEEEVLYGLVNIAAFLSQSMAESIKYDTCDEANWDFVNNNYPLSNACGQGGLSYQDMACPEEERHMECPVRKDMIMKAATHAKWLGGADGAPGPLYCGPKTSDQPFTGVWDHLYKCNRPGEDPPETCDVYEGQLAGRYDNSFPAGNTASRSDVEGCCWWGRGVIQTRGVCDIGKINYSLGKGAENSPYPNVDFCEDPEALCSSEQYKELRWVAGMSAWIMRVQSYNQGEWGYIPELIKFVDGGMVDADSFIDAVSGILIRGCHDDSCGEVQPSTERAENFNMILDEVFNLRTLAVDNGRTYAPTMKPTKRTRKPVVPTPKPTKRPRQSQPSFSPTLEPTLETAMFDSVTGPPVLSSELPTVWMPWYYNYDVQTCVNDGRQPAWLKQEDFFGIKKACCEKKVEVGVSYDVCMGKVTYGWSAQQFNALWSHEEEECPPTTGWAASSDCKSYFVCRNGARSGPVFECSEDTLYDVESSECRDASLVDCSPSESGTDAKISVMSESFSAPEPTRKPSRVDRPLARPVSPTTDVPTQAPQIPAAVKKPIAELWFGVSVQSGSKKKGEV